MRELIAEIAGAGEKEITEERFLDFVYNQLQEDPINELREIWKTLTPLVRAVPERLSDLSAMLGEATGPKLRFQLLSEKKNTTTF